MAEFFSAGEAKDAAMRLIRQLGYPIGGPHDTTQFDRDGVRYLFHRDGRVETHASHVPTSREQKSQWRRLALLLHELPIIGNSRSLESPSWRL